VVPAKQFKVEERNGQTDRNSGAATTKAATRLRAHAEGAVPRNRPAWKARTASSEVSDVRTRLPSGAPRSTSEADSALTPIARKSALPAAAYGLLQPREQWSSTAGS